MAEKRRRGLGRGLGALINSDAPSEPAPSGATAHAVKEESVSRETEVEGAQGPEVSVEPIESSASDREVADTQAGDDPRDDQPEVARPIDVFFSAKSHLATQKVTRGANVTGRSTQSRRPAARGRVEMPDVLTHRQSKVSRRASPNDSANGEGVGPLAGDNTGEGEPRSVEGESHAWTDSVSRETGGQVEGAEFRSIAVGSISPNPRQPREVFDEEHMAELVHSVREIGVLQPVVVRPVGDDQYELVMGERRWRASQAAGRETIPAIVRSTRDDDLLRDALLENIHRSQLNPLEEAAAYRQLLDDFQCTQDELADKIGRSRPQISNTLRLMKLPPKVQRRVAAGVLSNGHARALLGLESAEAMEDLAQRIVNEGLSVRATEEAVTMGQQTKEVSRETSAGRLPSNTRYQQLDELAESLIDRLDTQVKITLGAKKGRISIDFASMEDLHRLMDMIGPAPKA